MRTYVYVDGFNLYYGALKGTAYKWLNVDKLLTHLLPNGYTVSRIKYFTARVSGAADPQAPARQHAYLSALKTLRHCEIHYGSFLSKTVWRPLVNLPVASRVIHSNPAVTLPTGNHSVSGSRPQTLPVGSYPIRTAGQRTRSGPVQPLPDALIAEVHTMEEKGSDVNLAAHLINDAWLNAFDAAVVISNDTDLITPISMVAVQRQKPVFVVCPGRWQISPKLRRVATYVRHIRGTMLAASQFSDPIPGTTIRKPISW